MIQITRLNGKQIMINAELIESVEETPDTVITLTDGKKFVVKERAEEIKSMTVEYKKEVFADLCQIIAKSANT